MCRVKRGVIGVVLLYLMVFIFNMKKYISLTLIFKNS